MPDSPIQVAPARPADTATDTTTDPTGPPASTGELVGRLSEQVSTLVRDELRLAQAELTQKAKKAGIGAGLFGGAGITAVYAVGTLIAAAVLGLATAVPGWAAALIVGGALLVVVAVTALTGKKEVTQALPPAPTEAIDGLRTDVRTIQEARQR